MNKTLTGFQRYLIAAGAFLIGLILALAICLTPTVAFAAEDSTYFTEPDPVSLSIANKQFADKSGSAPSSPSSWTGASLDNGSTTGIVAGVMDLTPSEYVKAIEEDDVYKLLRYPEYKNNNPVSPFGTGKYEGTNKNVLLINTVDSETAYGYTSQSVSFAAGGFYHVSAFVKTGDFADGKGAAVKLNGLPEEVAFKNINTVNDLEKDADGLPILKESNLYGFKQFHFYVAAPNNQASSVTLSLQVGDGGESYNPAKGYAFFDNIVAESISANSFYRTVRDLENVQHFGAEYLVKDFNADIEHLTDSEIALSHFFTEADNSDAEIIGSFENGMDGWTRITDPDIIGGTTAAGHTAHVYDTQSAFDSENDFDFISRPISPVGNLEDNSKIFVISSKQGVAVGYSSPSYTVLRNTFYRISVWVNTQNSPNGAGASVVIRGTNGISEDEGKLVSTSTGLSGDSTNTMRYGWKQYSFYIKGSCIKDYDISVELWLGQPNSRSKGIAMFDEITVEKLTPSEYSANSSSGTIVTFDPTFTDTGMTNGLFYEPNEYEEYAYPMAPYSWELINAANTGTTGFSENEVKSAEDAIHGIICTDIEHFNDNRANYNYVSNPSPNSGNLLMISSLEPTAVAYRSPVVTVDANTAYRLTASVKVEDIEGYGANLVVRSGSNVIATIEGITSTGTGFKEYTFYINGGSAAQTVGIELWLGMGDRNRNESKLSGGTLFVNRVSFEAFAEGENYADYANEYNKLRSAGIKQLSMAAYSFASYNMTAYDYYDSSEVKTAYNWQLNLGSADNVVFGIIDSSTLPSSGRTEVPDHFKNSEDAVNNGVLYLRNRTATYAAIATNNAINLEENSYYKISVSMKVDIPEEFTKEGSTAVGAGIWLSGTDFGFENIKDTSTTTDSIVDKETFKTYSFYVKTGSAIDVWLAISLGDSTLSKYAAIGRVYVNNISVVNIGNVAYEGALKSFDEDSEGYAEYAKYNVNVDLSEENDEENTEDGETENVDENKPNDSANWWILPSILFGVAILIALIGTLIRKLLERRANKKKVRVTTTYDRNATLNKLHEAKENNGGKLPESVNEDDYENFDDTLSPAAPKPAKPVVTEEVADSYDEFDDSDKAAAPTADDKAEEAKADEVPEAEEAASEGAETATETTEGGEAEADKTEEKAEAPAKSEKPEVKEAPKAKPEAPKPAKDSYTDDFED